MTEWDAVIVGAGPAGSALACRLRPRYRVLLLERAAACASVGLPRIGESLPGAARVLLQRIGMFDRFLADAHVERGATVSQWERTEPVWFDHLRDPHGPGWRLDRARFDESLCEAAVAAGAHLIDACGRLDVSRRGDDWHIALEERGQAHRAPVVVDASGRNGAVARQLGVARRIEDTLTCLYLHLKPSAGDEDQCTRLCADENGWWYSVRVPSRQRVLAFHLDTDDAELKVLRDPERLLAKARRQPLLAEVLPGSSSASAASAPVQVRPAGSAVLDLDAMSDLAPGFFAVGDAVLAFDPLASQGIFHALASAESAAHAIEVQLGHAPDDGETYRAEMKAVQARYREHLWATYAGVTRYRDARFWSRRSRERKKIDEWRGA